MLNVNIFTLNETLFQYVIKIVPINYPNKTKMLREIVGIDWFNYKKYQVK